MSFVGRCDHCHADGEVIRVVVVAGRRSKVEREAHGHAYEWACAKAVLCAR